MTNNRKRKAIHSGIGDNDDLLVKQPKEEDVTESFQYASRLRGKKRHNTMIYPEIPFEYGISYTGQTVETYNEKPYEFNVNAHPEKVLAYRVEETKELPVKRMWEAKACFEAQVWRMNMKYALEWKGSKAVQVQNDVDYAVTWKASVVKKAISDARDLFTSANADFVGYGDSTTWKKASSGYVYDISNTSRFSGVIADDYYRNENCEVEFTFKPVLADNDQFVGGNDDDIVGVIFKAKDKRNFYMMLWERETRVKGSWRAPDHLNGFNMLTSGAQAWEDRVMNDSCDSHLSWSSDQMDSYSKYKGWREKHRRIYKVEDGIMKRVDTTSDSGTLGFADSVKDLGTGRGWDMAEMHTMRVRSIGTNVRIDLKYNGDWHKVFEFDVSPDYAIGSFGVVNVSQAVQFHSMVVKEKSIISGRIPETDWSISSQASKNLGTGYNYCISQAKQKANALKTSIPTVDSSTIDFLNINGLLKDSSLGDITNPIGEQQDIIVTAGKHTEQDGIGGRIPATGWFEFNGIGNKTHAPNALDYVKSQSTTAALSTVKVTSIKGLIYDDPIYNIPTGSVMIGALTDPIIVHNNNPTDADQIYTKCYVRCGIVEVDPDHRNYTTGLLVWDDIAKVFKDDYAEFFNRADYINKKETYTLVKPVKKDPPKPPPIEESEGGCVIEDPKAPPPDPVVQCLNDFDFDGKRLIMWSCEFPIEVTTKLLEGKIFAYQGWMTFDPLVQFTPNKWTYYKLIPITETMNPLYDEMKWADRDSLEKAPVGTKVIMRTKEWYKALFNADIINKGIVTSEINIESELPPAPEHYWLPDAKDTSDVTKRMPGVYENIHYLLDAWNNDPAVVMWAKSNSVLTTENASRDSVSVAYEGKIGMPILLFENDIDKLVIHCKENPVYSPWSSGKYIGYGKVNGKRPFWGNGSGKADMINLPTDVVFFPPNLVKETLSSPIVDIYDKEFPDTSRVKYRLHDSNTLLDFYSDHTDAYIWYTDWYSNWMDSASVFQAKRSEYMQIKTPIDLNPLDPAVSSDFNSDNTIIERIEVASNNPFVKLWIEEDKGRQTGLLGTYYRFPLASIVYEEKWQIGNPVLSVFTLQKTLGTYVEVYHNGVLLASSDYSIVSGKLTIKISLSEGDWIHLQSYKVNDYYDPTKREYLGEKQFIRLDFQEDVPSSTMNPNYEDTHYEGSFCFNWKYESPLLSAITTAEVKAEMSEPAIPIMTPPTIGNPKDGFTVSWNGYIYAPESGIYKFKATVNDGFRLWIRGQEIISEWHPTDDPTYFPDYEASIYLEGNKWHSIRANFFDNIGQALIRLHWARPGRGFQRISPDYLTPYLGYKVFSQVKQSCPLPWHPMIHSGYYYHEDREHVLYAEKIVQNKTPNAFHEVTISPRPQQGQAIIVRDNQKNNLRKVAFYDDNWNLTLENKEVFNGSGFAKYYLQYKGIDKATVKVKLNGISLLNQDYIFNEEESSIEFMDELSLDDTIEVRYILLYSYYIDMNADIVDGFVNKDQAIIHLHSNYDASKMINMEIIYEAAKETPFYRAEEVVCNPILTHNHTGFLYITENQEQQIKDLMVYLSDQNISSSGLEQVLLTARVVDAYNNPCPNKLVKIYRDDILIDGTYQTNEAGEVYLYDKPTPPDSLISVYKVECENLLQEVILDYYVDNQPHRKYLEIIAPKRSIMAGIDDEALIQVTLRNENWEQVDVGKTIQVIIRDTHGTTQTTTYSTDAYGQISFLISGLHEQHGNMMIQVSYDMGFETTTNDVYIKVIGG